jgi:hypothetical protein
MMKNKKGVNALHHEIRGRILNPAVNGWAIETLIPKMFRVNVFHSPGLQPWVLKTPETRLKRAFTPYLKNPKKNICFPSCFNVYFHLLKLNQFL